ncbi:PaaI family thioesterase [Tsukamurella sp. 8F]|uniref:PaaI family thioesterase n=1 Tax=unclassified Tsukamurella TaxID=2633480 RepID=UPI0023B9CF02|nr:MULTISPECIES: PaaI family thioesterase [unclassified Tsukamurella]MDF0530608.1 PaaI family thioesterase [Tsukamurella sp. 8J]MDF0587809.1 PaaI family thioesterase [Tsukamurella sp. 8F]
MNDGSIEVAALMPFAATLGIAATEATPRRVVCSLAYRPELTTAGGAVHGGALMTLADCAGAVLAFLNLPKGTGTATTSSTTSFLSAATAGTLTATATPIKIGRQVIVVQTTIADDAGRPLTTTLATQQVLTVR